MALAPIILFVYNRPVHTRRTVESLLQNEFVGDSELYIFADGPKNWSDARRVDEVREYIDKIKGFKEVSVKKQDSNRGLANSVIAGVTEILRKHGKAIVLEDDIVTAKNFLRYMNGALDFYENDKRIYSISGYVYPYKKNASYSYDVFLYPRASSWGWATWLDRWEKSDWEVTDYDVFIKDKKQVEKFNQGGEDLSGMLTSQMQGRIDSWAIRWCYTHFKNDGYGLFPIVNKVHNIGNDGTGTNCGASEILMMPLDDNGHVTKFVKDIPVNKRIILSLSKLWRRRRICFLQKLIWRLKYMLKKTVLVDIIAAINKRKGKGGSLEEKEYQIIYRKFKDYPRYKKAKIKFLNYSFIVPDIASFLFQIKEIFVNEIYKYNSQIEDPVILDCGANVGVSCLYFKKLFPEAKIKAYESDSLVAKTLEGNLIANGAGDIEIIRKAVWISDDGVEFVSDGADGGSVFGFGNKMLVPSVRLRDEILKENSIDFLKMDIEGAEVEVIKDCHAILDRVGNIFIEYHSWVQKSQELDEILRILKKNGFRYSIHSIGAYRFPYLQEPQTVNMDNQLNIFGYKVK